MATLLGCSPISTGSRNHQFKASYLLLGGREWREVDRVSIFEFCLPAATGSLSYGDHKEYDFEEDGDAVVYVNRTIPTRSEIMRVRGEGYEVVISKIPAISVARLEDINDDPTWISVRYDKAVSLEESLQVPFHIQTLFALSEGRPLRETGLAVQSEGDGKVEAPSAFALYRNWRPADYEQVERIGVEQIFRVFNRSDREITEKALAIWLARQKQWEVTYWLASQFVQAGEVTDRSKLMKVMAWFESIPDYKLDSGLTQTALTRFRRDARNLDSFERLGVPSERLSQVLNELVRLPLAERFNQAIRDVRTTFGEDVLGASIEQDCRLAIKLRNDAAHGSHGAIEENFREFVIATSAVETLAVLATLRELGVDRKRIRDVTNRFTPHPYASYQMWADSRLLGTA
ncbi:hypothetical protein NO932_04170 [Pelagibacterium sp. 26DY04]|uniref:hypothetical protein n=1 Tax=Pelagibacterium sp. 26DY04 TaxID=2967130 RepID=UPI002815302E|nr:hypothetical protein [Pelagibacterium sp. 26DY04]WMT87807.1 hypothetical protein NO932_04170 [Pelagibacterium sp. 26DY04]